MDMVIKVNNGVRCTLYELPPYRLFLGKDAFIEFTDDNMPDFLKARVTMIRARDEPRVSLYEPKPDTEIGWRMDVSTLAREVFCVVLSHPEITELRNLKMTFMDTLYTTEQLESLKKYEVMQRQNTVYTTMTSGTYAPTSQMYYGSGQGYANQGYAQQMAQQQAMNAANVYPSMISTAAPVGNVSQAGPSGLSGLFGLFK